MRKIAKDCQGLLKIALIAISFFPLAIFGTSNDLQSNNTTAINSIIIEILGPTAAANAVAGCAQITPIFGQTLSSGTSFVTVQCALGQVLNKLKLLAYKRADQLRTLAE